MIRASKPKRKKCLVCGRQINRKNFARHLKAHRNRGAFDGKQDTDNETKAYGEYWYR